jgi:hypothetical protein
MDLNAALKGRSSTELYVGLCCFMLLWLLWLLWLLHVAPVASRWFAPRLFIGETG